MLLFGVFGVIYGSVSASSRNGSGAAVRGEKSGDVWSIEKPFIRVSSVGLTAMQWPILVDGECVGSVELRFSSSGC
ncbi:hypothetical protein F4777DRAFT_158765 [Nemania sp. FL0916]|nr:hypothetical protein F4777DRAFT_158765 [Nemania sp. FL0916]